jgi:N-acetyl-anhydromuramyl-L-alanine amidase AmpD
MEIQPTHRELKDISIIVLHCSASDNPAHDDIAVIKQWHLERGFKAVGYHYFIRKNGDIQIGRTIDFVGAHTIGFNLESVGICLSGDQEFTEEQFKSAARLIDNLYLILPNLKKKYGVLPHRFFNTNKTCPNYQIKEVFKYMTAELNIDKSGKYI